MEWIRFSGLETAIVKQAAEGCRILGICGGYQMLGYSIIDDIGSEGGGEIRGMGLLPVMCVFQKEKLAPICTVLWRRMSLQSGSYFCWEKNGDLRSVNWKKPW